MRRNCILEINPAANCRISAASLSSQQFAYLRRTTRRMCFGFFSLGSCGENSRQREELFAPAKVEPIRANQDVQYIARLCAGRRNFQRSRGGRIAVSSSCSGCFPMALIKSLLAPIRRVAHFPLFQFAVTVAVILSLQAADSHSVFGEIFSALDWLVDFSVKRFAALFE